MSLGAKYEFLFYRYWSIKQLDIYRTHKKTHIMIWISRPKNHNTVSCFTRVLRVITFKFYPDLPKTLKVIKKCTKLNWINKSKEIGHKREMNLYYYSFKIFPLLWLAKSILIIHHNHLLMTKFGRILCLTRKWRQKCSKLQEDLGTRLSCFGCEKKKRQTFHSFQE